LTEKDKDFMRIALRLAARGVGYTSPNPPVGAVVVKKDRVVGKGYHQKAGTPHAEIHALKAAGRSARGATLYVTLEPCNHHGRTPPCTEAILASGIKRAVVGCGDPNPRVAGGGGDFLRSHGIQVDMGILVEQSRKLVEPFIKYATTGLPLVIAKAAASLDGKIATHGGNSRWISNERSRGFVHRLRHAVDAILVGVGTVIADNPRLTCRLSRGTGVNPTRVIVDTHLRTPPDSRVVTKTGEAPTLLATGPVTSRDKRSRLMEQGVEVVELPLEHGRVSLRALLQELGNREMTSLLVEGGAEIHGAFFFDNLVDKVYLFFAPKIIGGSKAVPVIGGVGAATVAEASNLKHVKVRRMGDDIMIEGYMEGSTLFDASGM
jgi:diaminohydroxyphosphoribosylaminopyrimidine deaminase/5-amino-6-(5-phosphoribosylamino)uracil reductase